MSSILKALKKIETDSTPPEEYTSWPQKIDTKTAINSGARKRWYYRKLASYFLVGLAIVAIGGLIFSQRDFISTRILPSITRANPESSSRASNSNGVRVFRAKIDMAQLTRTSSAPKSPVRQPSDNSKNSSGFAAGKQSSRGPAATRPQIGKAATAPPVKKMPPAVRMKKIAPKKTPLQPDPNALNAGRQPPPRVSKTARPAGKTTTGSKAEVQYSRLADAAFKLQAIAWAQEPAKRLAVINGRIIREGESVDGYTVTRIRQEGVLVNDGSKTWLLEFGLKQ